MGWPQDPHAWNSPIHFLHQNAVHPDTGTPIAIAVTGIVLPAARARNRSPWRRSTAGVEVRHGGGQPRSLTYPIPRQTPP
jgi:hypothetical protein